MKAVVAAFNQEKALVGAFSVLTNLRMELFKALVRSSPAIMARQCVRNIYCLMEGEDSTEHKANQILIFNQSGMNDMMDDRTSSWLEFCVVITGGELPHFMNFMNIAAVKFPSQPRIRPLSSALWRTGMRQRSVLHRE